MTKTILALGGALLVVAVATSACAGGNPLIGKWKYTGKGYVDREGFDWCTGSKEMKFTAKTQTTWNAATARGPASTETQPVNYLVNGAKVYVSSTQSFGSGLYWNFLSKNEIQSDNVGHCVFDRE